VAQAANLQGVRSVTIGTVKWFNSTKGYGFIEPEDGSKDAFVHISAVEAAGMAGLNEGQKVEYELVQDDRGRTSAGNLKTAE
jgi:CspA family cold shock protein